eukprot:4328123-Amphidinium_carterae.1
MVELPRPSASVDGTHVPSFEGTHVPCLAIARVCMSTSFPNTPMGSQNSLASTADINNPFSLDYVERVGPSPAGPLGAGVLTVRTLHTDELMDDEVQNEGYDDQQADFGEDDDLEMVPTPPATVEEMEEPGDLEAPSPCWREDQDVPQMDEDVLPDDEDVPPPPPNEDEVLPPPTFHEVPLSQLTQILNSPEEDEIPLDELPLPVSTRILSSVPPATTVQPGGTQTT